MPLNPRHMCDRVFEMVNEITARIKMLKMELKSRGRLSMPLNPRHMCDRVFEMVKEITARIKMLKMELKSRGR